MEYFEKNNLLYHLQSGFRKKHSCQTAVTRIIETWLSSINEAEITGAVFLDLRKAFDLVNHKILLKKLPIYGLHPNVVSLFQSYLSNRVQRVYFNGNYSSENTIKHGVPQGSVLGPLLFCIYINDMPLELSNSNVICDLFADDSTLHTSNKQISTIQNDLQQGLNIVNEWCNVNLMSLNPSKTKCMTITSRQRHQLGLSPLSLTVNNSVVQQVTEHRLLGVTIDNQLRWNSHITYICKNVSKQLFLFSKLKHYLDVRHRKMFFYAHIKPCIDYMSNVWDGTSQNHILTLNSLYRRAVKMILFETHIPTDDKFTNLKILSLNQLLKFNKCILMHRIITSKFPKYLTSILKIQSCPQSKSRLHLFSLPRPRIDLYKTSLSFSGKFIWNTLPHEIQNLSSANVFKIKLKQFLLSHYD